MYRPPANGAGNPCTAQGPHWLIVKRGPMRIFVGLAIGKSVNKPFLHRLDRAHGHLPMATVHAALIAVDPARDCREEGQGQAQTYARAHGF